MKILLINPETPPTFWSFRNALKFISKKSSEPPLGLLTVAALLPKEWEKRLVDLNVTRLSDEQLRWADYVFITGMNIQKKSMQRVIDRCKALGIPVVAGGPFCTTEYQELHGVDHFVLNEAEITLPLFLADLERGRPKRFYRSRRLPDITKSPIPQWDLLDQKQYASMSVQYSRGCPYDCEFCSITLLNGHRPRTKTREQFLAELDALRRQGWRGNVFIVDDNFIGNRRKLKGEILPALIQWSRRHGYPFSFFTEASINLADDEELVELMVAAGFQMVFVGIETPHDESLLECGKKINKNRDLLSAVKKLQHHGLIVTGGFIVGFDHDPPNIFEQQIAFIQKSGIVTAMVGLLNAPTGTRLFQRLKKENRLLHKISGDNMDGTLNFIPRMNYQQLLDGYHRLVKTIYSQKAYYERVKTFLQEYRLPSRQSVSVPIQDLLAFLKSIWKLGIVEKGRLYYWKLLLYSLLKYPRKFPLAVRMAIYGFHFRRVVKTV